MSIGSREQIRTEMVYEILRPPPQGSSPNKSSLLKFLEPSQTASPAGEPGFKHTSLRGTFHNQASFFFPVSCHLSASSIEPNHIYQLFLLPHEFLDLTHPPGSRTPSKGLLFPESTSVCQWEADQDPHVPLESPRAPKRQPLCISSVQREGKKHFILVALE